MEKNNALFASPADIAGTEDIYAGAFPPEARGQAKKNREKMEQSGKAYARSEDAHDASLAYIVGAMSGPESKLLDDPVACMAIGRVFSASPESEWEKYESMLPSELVALDARMNGG